MGFRGVTFNKQTCQSADDALIFHTFLNGVSGRVTGCNVTFDDENIYISNGYFMTNGRLVNVYGTETITPTGVTSGTKYCRLAFTVDLSLDNTASSFNQGYFEILEGSSGYPTLTQEDLFDGGTVSQIAIAKFTITLDGIGDFVDEMGVVNISDVWATIEGDMEQYRSQFDLLYERYAASYNTAKSSLEEYVGEVKNDIATLHEQYLNEIEQLGESYKTSLTETATQCKSELTETTAQCKSEVEETAAQCKSDMEETATQCKSDVEDLGTDFNTYVSEQKEALSTWMDTLHEVLDEDVAGHLQVEIDELKAACTASYDEETETLVLNLLA